MAVMVKGMKEDMKLKMDELKERMNQMEEEREGMARIQRSLLVSKEDNGSASLENWQKDSEETPNSKFDSE